MNNSISSIAPCPPSFPLSLPRAAALLLGWQGKHRQTSVLIASHWTPSLPTVTCNWLGVYLVAFALFSYGAYPLPVNKVSFSLQWD